MEEIKRFWCKEGLEKKIFEEEKRFGEKIEGKLGLMGILQ